MSYNVGGRSASSNIAFKVVAYEISGDVCEVAPVLTEAVEQARAQG